MFAAPPLSAIADAGDSGGGDELLRSATALFSEQLKTDGITGIGDDYAVERLIPGSRCGGGENGAWHGGEVRYNRAFGDRKSTRLNSSHYS